MIIKQFSVGFQFLFTYKWDLFPTQVVIKVKPNINSVGVHLQLSNNRHPVDGALVGAAGSLYMAGHSFIHS
jgi:hypothetical protein